MNSILIIDKPGGFTSHDVVARVRRILKTKRVGHTGTLDPFATGVLVLLIGKATRLAQFLDKDEKEYETIVKFGYETDTGDRTGAKSAEFGALRAETGVLSSRVAGVLDKFRGEIQQTPPMYSAKKVGGKKLYELARKGQEVERKPIAVTISKLELVPGDSTDPADEITLNVACSAGTYVRTLAEDIGRELGTAAHLQELRRTRAGKFTLSQSVMIEALEQMADPSEALLPIDDAVSHLPELRLPADRVERTRNGLASRYDDSQAADGEAVRMLTPDNQLAAIGIFDAAEYTVQPKVVLI
jgi:tRNA pseudouridine55 synthase